ncbi:MAG: hydroxymethylglutaryl-CoA lyase [Bacteroidia bacterium]
MEFDPRLEYVECPRDAMQGIQRPISTQAKIELCLTLLQCQFDILDCGSFVNPATIPQMADSAEVIQAIAPHKGRTKLLVIVANLRGALRACSLPGVDYLGFPFSVSEAFQRRNTNSSRSEAYIRLAKIQALAKAAGKEVVAYISMGFGNPYGEPYSEEEVLTWVRQIQKLGIRNISLADTTGQASPSSIHYLFQSLCHSDLHVSAHFHAQPQAWMEKVKSAYDSGCRRFEGAFGGFGGCPMAKDDLTGNVPTEQVLPWLISQGDDHSLITEAFEKAAEVARNTYG